MGSVSLFIFTSSSEPLLYILTHNIVVSYLVFSIMYITNILSRSYSFNRHYTRIW
ncbi:hypothetical protein Goari_019290 [Gossypium aridum]|uniref:Uncharacterized protein n=1 Tax=Gossypium aridum TaxID=34290 RepID=A0A7J8WTD2_GOSAI|nr:hypothetical protein [Gossypium aridum]